MNEKIMMKKIIKVLSIIILIISIIIISIIVISNLLTIIRIMFFGITLGSNEVPDTIWFKETLLYGFSGIQEYFSVLGEAILIVEFPISIVCLIYQIIYFKIIRKKL